MEKAALFRVKTGQWSIWKQWCAELATTLRKEVTLTLQEEQVLQELVIGFDIDGTHYIIGFMEGDCLPANMNREVNLRHKEMKEQCLEYAGVANILYNIAQRN
jgi:hypothetical protein